MNTRQPLTPAAKLLSRYLPQSLTYIALCLLYTLLILGIMQTIGFVPNDMVYMDVPIDDTANESSPQEASATDQPVDQSLR